MTFGQQNTEAESHAILDAAFRLGINFIDTAEVYPVPPTAETVGKTEEYIGTWIAKGSVPRNKIILATKVAGPDDRPFVVANRTVPRTAGGPAKLDRANILQACDASLRRLKTDYIDLYQLHWPQRYTPTFGKTIYDSSKERKEDITFEETVSAIGELIKSGKVKHWGVCNESTYGVAEMVHAAKKLGVPPPVSIQNCYNLFVRNFDTELAEACSKAHYNIGLLSYSPLAGGQLTGKYLDGKPDGARSTMFPNFQARFFRDAPREAAKAYADIAKKAGISPAQLALVWCKTRSFMGSTIIGATKVQQLEENVKAFDLELSTEVEKEVNQVFRQYGNPASEDFL